MFCKTFPDVLKALEEMPTPQTPNDTFWQWRDLSLYVRPNCLERFYVKLYWKEEFTLSAHIPSPLGTHAFEVVSQHLSYRAWALGQDLLLSLMIQAMEQGHHSAYQGMLWRDLYLDPDLKSRGCLLQQLPDDRYTRWEGPQITLDLPNTHHQRLALLSEKERLHRRLQEWNICSPF